MTKKARNWLIAIVVVAFPFLLFLGCFIFLEEPLTPFPPVPDQNGYDDFRRAAAMLSPAEPDYATTNGEHLRDFVTSNAPALQLAREGLEKESAVPVEFTEAYISNHVNDLTGVKRLALAFTAEGRLAEMENHYSDAAKIDLDTFQLGTDCSRGGVLIDQLVGIAVEAIATSHLTNLVNKLDAASCRETAARLEALDSQQQTWADVMEQERTWSHRTFSGLRYDYMRFMTRKSSAAAFQKSGRKFELHEQETRQLIIDLAARAYELDKGKPPASVSDLVPDYLKAVPTNPFTGSKMTNLPR